MRTPAADLILLEFHRQKYGIEGGEAEGQENTSPNSAFFTEPQPQPDSPMSGQQHLRELSCHTKFSGCFVLS